MLFDYNSEGKSDENLHCVMGILSRGIVCVIGLDLRDRKSIPYEKSQCTISFLWSVQYMFLNLPLEFSVRYHHSDLLKYCTRIALMVLIT